jgi:hypothetical protein
MIERTYSFTKSDEKIIERNSSWSKLQAQK